eukprot:611006-Pleurochrysis_carterae.AAC.1
MDASRPYKRRGHGQSRAARLNRFKAEGGCGSAARDMCTEQRTFCMRLWCMARSRKMSTETESRRSCGCLNASSSTVVQPRKKTRALWQRIDDRV